MNLDSSLVFCWGCILVSANVVRISADERVSVFELSQMVSNFCYCLGLGICII